MIAPEIAAEAVVLDLDDTIYDTSRAFELTVRLAVSAEICGADVLNAARKEKEDVGKTFDLDAFLRGMHVPDDEIAGLYDALGDNTAGEDLLYEDGRRLVTALTETQAPAYIRTRGTPRRQIGKLRSVDLLDFPHIITDELVKSQGINANRGPRGEYIAETTVGLGGLLQIRSWRGVLIEDRPKGLAGLQYPGWAGVLVRRQQAGEELRPAHRGIVPPGVMVVPNLDSVVEQIYQLTEVGDMVRRHLAENPVSV